MNSRQLPSPLPHSAPTTSDRAWRLDLVPLTLDTRPPIRSDCLSSLLLVGSMFYRGPTNRGPSLLDWRRPCLSYPPLTPTGNGLRGHSPFPDRTHLRILLQYIAWTPFPFPFPIRSRAGGTPGSVHPEGHPALGGPWSNRDSLPMP